MQSFFFYRTPFLASFGLFLQEVLAAASTARGDGTLMIGDSGEDLELWFQVLAKVHNGGDVAASVTVIGCRPDGYHVLVFEVVLIAFIDQLMSPGNQL